jgi:hypothetical protein
MDSTELIQAIREAFRGVKLEDGVSLNMTEYNDSGGSEKIFKQLAVDDERDDWRAIDEKTLEKFTVTFSFTDWKGFRFYLPAYMIYAITHPESTSIIGDHTVYSLNPGSILKLYGRAVDQILNRQQLEACVQFLQFCGGDSDDGIDRTAFTNLNRMKKYL